MSARRRAVAVAVALLGASPGAMAQQPPAPPPGPAQPAPVQPGQPPPQPWAQPGPGQPVPWGQPAPGQPWPQPTPGYYGPPGQPAYWPGPWTNPTEPKRVPPTRPRNPELMYAGIAAVIAGGAGFLIGSVVFATANHSCETPFGKVDCVDEGQRTTGVGLMIASGATMAIGIPFWAVGGSKVPDTERSAASLVLSPRGAALRASF